MPGRFAIVLMMAFAVVFALALRHIRRQSGDRRGLRARGRVGAAGARAGAAARAQLFAAPVPEFYRIIASDPRDVRVLGIPLGFVGRRAAARGRMTVQSQYYQTFHQKPIVGGGISRISNAAAAAAADVSRDSPAPAT